MPNFPLPPEQRLVSLIAQLDRRLKRVEHLADDPVAIGGQLARTSIGSPGYVAGSNGWQLNADGTGQLTGTVSVLAGGMRVTLGPTAPASPNVGDLWYDATNGYLLNQWNGTAWTPYAFGTNAINAGAITTALLAAGAVTAAKIAAGTIVAGIIDGTVVRAPTLIGSETLAYVNSTAARGPTLYDFETGLQGWSMLPTAGGVLSQSSAWAFNGTYSALITCNGTANPIAVSPIGTAGIPVMANDGLGIEVYFQSSVALNNCFIGIRWYDSTGTFIREDDSADAVISQVNTTYVYDFGSNAPANGYATIVFGDHENTASGSLIYFDYYQISGNLAFSFAGVPGTDSAGNIIQGGLSVNGLPGIQNAFAVYDAYGDDLQGGIDAAGNVVGMNIAASTDIYLAGESLTNSILPGFPQGIVAYTGIPVATLPWPSSPNTGGFTLYEIDVQCQPGRHYMLVIEEMGITFSGSGIVGTNVNLLATCDGSTPTSGGTTVARYSLLAGSATQGRGGPFVYQWDSLNGAFWRFLITTGNMGSSSQQLTALQSTAMADDPYGALNWRTTIYDMGPTVPQGGLWIGSTTGGGGGTTKQTYTKTYTAVHTRSYQGSNGTNANLLIDTDGKAYQGGDVGNTYNGDAKTWFSMPSSMGTDLSGATINWAKMYLNNNHTWYGSGMTARMGIDSRNTWPSTAGDPSGAVGYFTTSFSQGQAKWVNLPSSWFSRLAAPGTYAPVIWANTSNLSYYGYFAGAGQSGPPQIQVNYTK
jgi:hypothetical protein